MNSRDKNRPKCYTSKSIAKHWEVLIFMGI